MDYTREPIIETIITPRDGSKLTIRNSKVKEAPEYSVDAVEVVSFGNSFFYRSMERPKSFLVPVSDYEVVETKETRVVLKNATIDKSIKIAGGRVKKETKDEPKKSRRKTTSKSKKTEEKASAEKKEESKRKTTTKKSSAKKESSSSKDAPTKEGGTRVSSSMFRSLFPPPSSLISEKLAKEPPQAPVPDAPPVAPAKEEKE